MTETTIKDEFSVYDLAKKAIRDDAEANEASSLHGAAESVWKLWTRLMQRKTEHCKAPLHWNDSHAVHA